MNGSIGVVGIVAVNEPVVLLSTVFTKLKAVPHNGSDCRPARLANDWDRRGD